MNNNQLFALYDRVADVPGMVGRLRRFVLDLAVRGKLVEQDPTDEPANELLKRITDEAERHSEGSKQRRRKVFRQQMASPPFELPRTWCWISLGTVFQYDAGMKCDPKHLDPSAWLLELKDVEKGTGRLLNRVRTVERKPKSAKSQFSPGDILYGKLRPYLNKVLVADKGGYSTTEIVAIRPYLRLSSEYCALALRRPDFVQYVTRLGQGTKMPRLRTKDAVVAPFPLPPLAEQYRIVAKVNELTTLCDQLETARKTREETRNTLTKASLIRLSAPNPDERTFHSHARFAINALPALTLRVDQVKHLRQVILNLAMRGKLVKQDPADEPASELLNRITAEKLLMVKAGTTRRSHKLRNRDSIHRFDLPTSWEWSDIESLAHVIMGQSPPSEHYNRIGNGLAFFQGKSDFGVRHPTPRYWCTKSTKTAERGDILLSIRAPVGPTNVADQQCCIGRGLAALRPLQGLSRDFMLLALKAFEPDLASRGFGTTFSAITKKQLTAYGFPLPPLAEQHRIVKRVNELMTHCDKLETGIANADLTRTQLLEFCLCEMLASTTHEAAATSKLDT